MSDRQPLLMTEDQGPSFARPHGQTEHCVSARSGRASIESTSRNVAKLDSGSPGLVEWLHGVGSAAGGAIAVEKSSDKRASYAHTVRAIRTAATTYSARQEGN